ncbi:hypothetical protein [Aeromonas enteropelogenes]
MDYTLISGIVGGLGIGTLLNSIISNVIARSAKRTDRLYEEK